MMMMDNLQEGSSKQDRTSVLKDQVSKIYMSTIAANEREDRLLSKRLDAIDMEHRAQYLRMRKIIRDAQAFSKRRFPALLSGGSDPDRLASGASSRGHTAPAKGISSSPDERPPRGAPEEHTSRGAQASLANNSGSLSSQPADSKSVGRTLEQKHGRELVDRLKYTEQEVLRIRKSFAGQKSPPVRKRTFLPHLENRPEMQTQTSNTRTPPTVIRGLNANPAANGDEGQEAALPEIRKKSTPTSIDRRKTLAGTNASVLRSMKRQSTALSRSLPSSF